MKQAVAWSSKHQLWWKLVLSKKKAFSRPDCLKRWGRIPAGVSQTFKEHLRPLVEENYRVTCEMVKKLFWSSSLALHIHWSGCHSQVEPASLKRWIHSDVPSDQDSQLNVFIYSQNVSKINPFHGYLWAAFRKSFHVISMNLLFLQSPEGCRIGLHGGSGVYVWAGCEVNLTATLSPVAQSSSSHYSCFSIIRDKENISTFESLIWLK